MNTRIFPRLSPVLIALALLSAVLGTSGCVAVAAGAGAGAAAVAYVRGQLETTLDDDYDSVVSATNRAIEQLGFAKISEKKDALVAVIVARNATDTKIEVRVDNAARKLTKVRIRVGVFGDEALSIAILDKIKANL